VDPSQRLSFAINQVAAEIAERGSRAVAEFGFDERSLGVLIVLDNLGSLPQRQIGELLGIDRTTMVAVIDGLESDKRVKRQRSAPDRRTNHVTITDIGRTVLAAADEALQHCEDDFVAVLTPQERATVMNLIGKLPQKDVLLRSQTRRTDTE
jgi:DNA-binding MarR family transcriptional regulator